MKVRFEDKDGKVEEYDGNCVIAVIARQIDYDQVGFKSLFYADACSEIVTVAIYKICQVLCRTLNENPRLKEAFLDRIADEIGATEKRRIAKILKSQKRENKGKEEVHEQ